MELEIYGEPVEQWMDVAWWPTNREALVMAGYAGHDGEITVNIDGYDWDKPIPRLVEEIFIALLPETWKIESRGTRIEVHPSGRFAGGFHEDDIAAVEQALKDMRLKVVRR